MTGPGMSLTAPVTPVFPMCPAARRRRRPSLRGLCLALALTVCGCGGHGPPSVLLALDGPPLAVHGTLGDTPFSGTMDRGCLAGVGAVALTIPAPPPEDESIPASGPVLCRGDMDRPGNEKGRRYIELACSDGSSVVLALRNLGPDQGMGIGKQDTTEKRVALFYHPSAEEAERRLAAVRADLAKAEETLAKKQAALAEDETHPSE